MAIPAFGQAEGTPPASADLDGRRPLAAPYHGLGRATCLGSPDAQGTPPTL
jgi:hypothetical protein